jgi:hypothetical protein
MVRSLCLLGLALLVVSAPACATDSSNPSFVPSGPAEPSVEPDSGVLGSDAGQPPATPPDGGSPDAGRADAGHPEDPPACPVFASRVNVGTVSSSELTEVSGLMASRKNPGVLWVHNDSGDSARVFALTTTGKLLGTYNLGNATARDWEDLGLAQVDGQWFLVIGDIGGNSGRPQVQVYFVPEPVVSTTQALVNTTLQASTTLNLDYPDGEHNAESLFVDPRTGDLFIVAKSSNGVSPVFRKSSPHVTSTATLEKVMTLDFSGPPLAGTTTTAADISPDGSELIVKTYTTTYLWRRAEGASVKAAFQTIPCVLPQAPGETIAFTPDAANLYSIAEKSGTNPVYVFRYGRK